MGQDRFIVDIENVVKRILLKYGEKIAREVDKLRDKLVDLHQGNRVKINHSVMEIVLGAYMLSRGYSVDVEVPVGDTLVADMIAWKSDRKIIIEIETGFTSPENALDPQAYLTARTISKVARYGKYADIFSFGTPNHNILPIPTPLIKPPSKRLEKELLLMKKLCDLYYSNPPITIEDIANAKIKTIYILNIDTLEVREEKTRKYLQARLKTMTPTIKIIEKYLEWSQHSEQAGPVSMQPHNHQVARP